MLTVCKAECVVCTLPLVRGPDQRRHEIGEARQMQQAARLEGKKGGNRWWEKHWMTDDGRLRKINVALAALLFLGLLCAGALAVGRLFDNSPESRVRAFTYMCLAGNQNGAIAYLPDDMVQCAEFDRWRTRYFPSILDEHRPAGDVVRIDVEMIGETPQTRVVRVTMTSRFMGKRAHEQRWQKTGDQWFFDPAITLKMHDQP